MLILLASALYSSQVLSKPVVASNLQLPTTLTCTFNGSNYSLLSQSLDSPTCENIMHDAAAAMDILLNDRSVTDILWSCLATVFACTWVSVHPNIPHPDATDWHIRRHRGLLMLCGLIAPELIVLWALRQWIGAHYLVRKMKEGGVCGFTMVHGHFMQMGGFIQNEPGRDSEAEIILDYRKLDRLKLPSAGQIQDKSKGDGLSKALVVGQTAWFVAQCISRWASGLAVTEAELVTLAFAALNGVIYFLWWDKPQDVRYAIQVASSPKTLPDESTARIETLSIPCSIPPSNLGDDLQNIQRLLAESYLGKLLLSSKTSLNQRPDSDFATKRNPTVSMLHSCFLTEDSFAATGVASSIGIIFGAIHCAAWNFEFLTKTERTLWRVSSTLITTVPIVPCIRSAATFVLIKQAYCYRERDSKMRNESFIRMLLPVVHFINLPSVWLTAFLIPIYVVARLSLLIQAVLALRTLFPRERTQVEWVDLLPHL